MVKLNGTVIEIDGLDTVEGAHGVDKESAMETAADNSREEHQTVSTTSQEETPAPNALMSNEPAPHSDREVDKISAFLKETENWQSWEGQKTPAQIDSDNLREEHSATPAPTALVPGDDETATPATLTALMQVQHDPVAQINTQADFSTGIEKSKMKNAYETQRGFRNAFVEEDSAFEFLKSYYAGADSTETIFVSIQGTQADGSFFSKSTKINASEFLVATHGQIVNLFEEKYSDCTVEEVGVGLNTFRADSSITINENVACHYGFAADVLVGGNEKFPDITTAISRMPIPPSYIIGKDSGICQFVWKFKQPIHVKDNQDREKATQRIKEFGELARRQAGKYADAIRIPDSLNYFFSVPFTKNTPRYSGNIAVDTQRIDNLIAAGECADIIEELQAVGSDKEFEELLTPAQKEIDVRETKTKSFARIEYTLIAKLLKEPAQIEKVMSVIGGAAAFGFGAFDIQGAQLAYNNILQAHAQGIKLDVYTLPTEMLRDSMTDSVKVEVANFVVRLEEFARVCKEQVDSADIETYAKILRKRQIEQVNKSLGNEIERYFEKNRQLRQKFDAQDFYQKFGERLQTLRDDKVGVEETGGLKLETAAEYFQNEWAQDIETRRKYAEKPTGFKSLDEIQNFAPGIYTIGALPGMGKSTFVWQLLDQAAEQGSDAFYISFEMSRAEMFSKTLTRHNFLADRNTGLTNSDIKLGGKNATIEKLIKEMGKSDGVKFLEGGETPIETILKFLRKNCDIEKSPVIAFDYLQLIQTEQERNARTELTDKKRIDIVLAQLKAFQVETNARIVLVSSLNRMNYNKKVSMAAFKESGSIEYYSSVLWVLSPTVKAEKTEEGAAEVQPKTINDSFKQSKRPVTLTCFKNRVGVSNYEVDFVFYAAFDNFEDCGMVIGSQDEDQDEESPKSEMPKKAKGSGKRQVKKLDMNEDYTFEEEDDEEYFSARPDSRGKQSLTNSR